MKPPVILLFLMIIHLSVHSKVWTISGNQLDVSFDDQSAALTVKDKRCGKAWEQVAHPGKFIVRQTTAKANTMNVELEGDFPVKVSFVLREPSSLEISLTAPEKTSFKELAFPSAFITPGNDHYLLETDGQGLLLPVDDRQYPLGNGIT